MGAQVNTNCITYHFEEKTTFKAILKQTSDFISLTKSEKSRYGYYPIQDIVKANACDHRGLLKVSCAETNLRRSPFTFENVEVIDVSQTHSVDGIEKNGLGLEEEVKNNKIHYRFRYSNNDSDPHVVNDLALHYEQLFVAILKDITNGNIDKPLKDYSIGSRESLSSIKHPLELFSNQKVPYKTLTQLFEYQVNRSPRSTAVRLENQELSYEELNNEANELARSIRGIYQSNKGFALEPNTLIPLYVDRGLGMLVAILAVLKSGGAYVPMHPDDPDERIKYILKNINASIVITQKHLRHKLTKINESLSQAGPSAHAFESIVIEDAVCQKTAAANLEPHSGPSDLAYVIYTSGTTGAPKGILQTHANVVDLFHACQEKFDFHSDDTWTLFHSYSFDFSIWEIWGALLHGGKLIIPTKNQTQDMDLFCELCSQEKVTVLNQTPTAFQHFSDTALNRNSDLSSLRYIIFGGERLRFQVLNAWIKRYGYDRPHLINMYGITETTVHVTYLKIQPQHMQDAALIGSPLAGQVAFVLDPYGHELPRGAVGELYVGGRLAQGYLGNPLLTKERFITHPSAPHTRLYKTGDLVRLTPEGALQFIGRNDAQIKIRGFRVELGEIESVIFTYPEVKQTTVLAKKMPKDASDQGTQLVAYYTTNEGEAISKDKLATYAHERLPKYMVPHFFAHLQAFPLTINGKIDHKALSNIEFNDARHHLAPTNAIEQKLCEIWSDVLDRDRIGIQDDFFDIGGHSIAAISAVSYVKKLFSIKYFANQLFIDRTIQSMARSIETLLKKSDIKMTEDHNLEEDVTLDCEIQFAKTPKTAPLLHIFLTGATGFVGAFLLKSLLCQNLNRHVYCLIRATTLQGAKKRLYDTLNKYQLIEENDAWPQRAIPVLGDLSQPYLGLTENEFHEMGQTVDGIIHNGASVNFLTPYSEIKKTNVIGTQETLRLACEGVEKPYHYISTLSVFQSERHDGGDLIQEDQPLDAPQALKGGYPMSKWVGEKIVMLARSRGAVANIFRLGRVSGHSRTGIYNKNDILNQFIRACLHLQLFPDGDVMLDLMPVDHVADAITHVVTQKNNNESNNFHLVQKQPISLKSFMKLLSNRSSIKIKSVSQDDWMDALKERNQHGNGNASTAIINELIHSKDTIKRLGIQFHYSVTNTWNSLKNSQIDFPYLRPKSLHNLAEKISYDNIQ